MKKIYFFIGVVGSGKSTYAQKLKEIYPNEKWSFLDFKSSLIDYVSNFCGFDVSKNYDNFKENVFGINDLSVSKKLLQDYPDLLTGRKLLQKIGTDLFRKYDSNFWINQFDKSLANLDGNVACCDLRFENELRYAFTLIEKYDVNFVLCNYPSERYQVLNHESELLAQKVLKYALPRKEKFKNFFDTNAYLLDQKTMGMFLF